jgi:nucleotide-binding universal stress UspA family protein
MVWYGRNRKFALFSKRKITFDQTIKHIIHIKTNHMKKVLIALDYDPTAQKVAEAGFSLAKSLNAEVILLHVIRDAVFYTTSEFSPIMGYNGYVDVSPTVLDNIAGLKDASLQYLEKTRQHLGDKTIQTMVKGGEFAETILESAKELHADIIVLGSHSQKWLENIVMGSVTEKVLHHSSIPLFIIPTKKHN